MASSSGGSRSMWSEGKIDAVMGVTALSLLIVGSLFVLWWAPKEAFMGDVYRILYVHVPAAWIMLIAYVVCFAASVKALWSSSARADHLAEASAEIGVVLNFLVLVTGSIWGRPTWGVWWAWDPRLTTAAVMLFAYGGYLALRHFVDDPDKRSTWAAVVAILCFVNIPVVWFSVKWWNTLHQVQSSPKTMSEAMVTALRLNAFAFLAFYIWVVRLRTRMAQRRDAFENAPPPAEVTA